MVSARTWKVYPQTYRTREVRILADWIRSGESGSVVGLAGAGKSNLLGFICCQPHVIAERYLDNSFKLALVLVDLNNLPQDDLSTFFRVILRSLYEARVQLADIDKALPDIVQLLYHKVEEKTDPFVSQSAVREAILAFSEKKVRLVLVLDPFDGFCRDAPTRVLDNLRGLRDSFKTNLSFIVGLRRELAYIRDPAELGELYEILDTHLCWLGPMEQDDARWVVSQVEKGMGRSFDDEQAKRLIGLTGGYPALLRTASLWLAHVSSIPDMAEWEKHLLAEPSIENRLGELWQGLTAEEQAALSDLQTALTSESDKEREKGMQQIESKHQHALSRLHARHILIRTRTGRQLCCPLFAGFVKSVKGIRAGRIWLDRQTERFFQGETELADLSEQDRRLLCHFLDHPLVVHSIDGLIDAAWAQYDSSGVTNAAVQQAIRHLRKQIEPDPGRPRYLITQHRAGYRFIPEGAPRERPTSIKVTTEY